MLEPRRLRYFATVAEELHFGRAAERLHMAQPPLTRHISALEQELGVRLFDRSTRAVKLTPEGAAFLPYARDALDALARAQEAADAAARGAVGAISIGYASAVPLSERFAALVRGFGRAYPDVRLTLTETASAIQRTRVADGSLDVGFAWAFPDDANEACAAEQIGTDNLMAVVPAESRYAKAGQLSLRQLAAEPFVSYPAELGSALRRVVFALAARAGFELQPGALAAQATTIVALVAAERGVSVLPESACALRNEGVAYVPLADDGAVLSLMIVWRAAGASVAARAFVDWVKRSCAEDGGTARGAARGDG